MDGVGLELENFSATSLGMLTYCIKFCNLLLYNKSFFVLYFTGMTLIVFLPEIVPYDRQEREDAQFMGSEWSSGKPRLRLAVYLRCSPHAMGLARGC